MPTGVLSSPQSPYANCQPWVHRCLRMPILDEGMSFDVQSEYHGRLGPGCRLRSAS